MYKPRISYTQSDGERAIEMAFARSEAFEVIWNWLHTTQQLGITEVDEGNSHGYAVFQDGKRIAWFPTLAQAVSRALELVDAQGGQKG